jgi:hypothetical protein
MGKSSEVIKISQELQPTIYLRVSPFLNWEFVKLLTAKHLGPARNEYQQACQEEGEEYSRCNPKAARHL